MQFVTYRFLEKEYCGLLDQGFVKQISYPSLMALLTDSKRNLEQVLQTVGKSVPLNDVVLKSPLPVPTTMRDAYTFRQHVEASRKNRGLPMIPEFDLFPIYYYTNHMAVTGPGEIQVMPLHLEKLDFELEAAIVIGKKGKNIKASDADEYIFGYTIMNDWSAREVQMQEMKMNLGPAKGKDFATSLGPVVVTREHLLKAGQLQKTPRGEVFHAQMKAFINGKQYSEANCNQMRWTFAEILERISYGVTLYPGDVIGSGSTGTGCLLELNGSKVVENFWLKTGDTVVLEVEGIGKLENKIVAAP